LSYEWDVAGAEEAVQAALAINPTYSRAWQMLAGIYVTTGRIHDAAAAARRALELDPLALSLHAFMAMNDLYSRRYDDAIEYGRRTIDMDANYFPGYFYLGLAYQSSGRLREAVQTLEDGQRVGAESTLMRAALGGAYAAAGRPSEALQIVGELDGIQRRKYVPQTFVAAIHLALGDVERAIAGLQRAYSERCYWLMRAVTVDARFDALRADARFHEIRRKMGLAGVGADA